MPSTQNKRPGYFWSESPLRGMIGEIRLAGVPLLKSRMQEPGRAGGAARHVAPRSSPIGPDLKVFRRTVLRFYRRNKRDLPWRRTRDPYRILVSEIMLQQTQVDRVIPKYRRFLARFPTLRSLAAAPFADVLRAWLGLGYNGRALRLWRCARAVVAERGGVLPAEVAQLEGLPGIGPYTAAAVAAIAFDAQIPVVDVNVARVLSRALAGQDRLTPPRLSSLALAALPSTSAAEWAQALMDLGALHCRANPQCDSCPARSSCAYVLVRRGAGPRARVAQRIRVAARERFAGSSRFYRGRVMHALGARGVLELRALGREVKEGFGASDLPWLRDLLQGLARDGLILFDRRRVKLP